MYAIVVSFAFTYLQKKKNDQSKFKFQVEYPYIILVDVNLTTGLWDRLKEKATISQYLPMMFEKRMGTSFCIP